MLMAPHETLAIFRDTGFGTKLSHAATKYLADWVYSDDPDGPYADHELTAFERAMIEDFLAGLFADDKFSGLLQEAARGMKAAGLDPEGVDLPSGDRA